MSRRKQSNPKSIKVSADSPQTEGTDKDADVRDDVLSEMGDEEDHSNILHLKNNNARREGEEEGDVVPTEEQLNPKKAHHHQRTSTSESADSLDHIDVVNTACPSPGQSSSPSPVNNHHPHTHPHRSRSEDKSCRRSSLASPSVVVKVEKPDDDDVDEDENERRESEKVGSLRQRLLSGDRARSGSGSGLVSGSALSEAVTDSSTTQGLVKHLQLPSDVLYLKEVEVTVHGTITPSWMICSAIPLPKGSSLGPFSGHMVSSDNIRVGNLILEFHSKTGHVVLVNVAGLSGAWLALLRPAVSELTRNALVYLEGGRIWCEIVSDVEIGMELRATFVFDMEDLSVADKELSLLPALSPSTQVHTATDKTTVGPSSPTMSSSSESSAILQQPSPGHAALIYGCPFCGVRFSSPRTLQGHLSYYCSKKKAQHIVSPRSRTRPPSDCQSTTGYTTDITTVKLEADCTDATKTSSSSQQQAADTNSSSSSSSSSSNSSSNSRSSSSGGGRGVKRLASVSDNSSGSNEDTSPPPPKAGRVDGGSPAAHHCPLCSYRTDKTASLTRHMRIHNRPPDPEVKAGGEGRVSAVGGQSGSGGVLCSAATFCKECNIQFSSLSTFQCHKKHYCSQRNIGRLADRTADSPQFGMAAVPPLGLGGGMSAASLGLASLGQNGLLFPAAHPLPSADTAGALPVTAAIMPNGQPAVILTAPVMTPTGITSMAIPLSTVLQSTAVLQSIQAAAAAARVSTPLSPPVSATSPQKSSSPAKLDASPRSSVPEEAHQSKSPKRAYSSEAGSSKDLPLDLSTKKPDTDVSGPPDRKIKKEKEEDGSPGAPTTSGSSPRRSNSTEGFPGGSAATATTTSTTTSSTPTPTPTPLPALPPHLLTSSLLQPFLPLTGMAVPVKPPAHIFGAGMPPGSSKCMDCNIIFYKHENYLAHKQHYCSERKKLRPVGAGSSAAALSPRVSESVGVKVEPSSTVAVATPESGKQSPVRTVSPDKDDEPSSISQPVFATSTSLKPPPLVPTPSANTPEVYYKFFCVPCKIKFSSASNLKAHKDYYCPHGKNSEHSIIAHRVGGEIIPTGGASVEQQASPGSSESSPSPGQYGCPQCRGTFTSSRLLKLHLCSAEVAQASVLKCSHCDYLTHTDKRLAEHMKVHNPTSAYRCTLCGYRGNTVRGMRMHGKTHTDNGEDFTDDHMIEFQEPPLVPIQTNSDLKAAQGPFSVEAELLRLKNEPYKRRRSRKAYEKVDLLVSLDDPQTCHLCGECLPDHPTLVDHLRQHLREHQQSIGDHLLLPCPHCGVVTSTQHLAAHMDLAHGSPVPREEKENHPQTPTCPHSPPPQRFESSSLEKRSPVRVKEEPLDSDCENRDSEGQRNTESEPAVDALPTDGGEDSAEEGSPSVGRPDSEVNSASQEVDVERSVGQEGSPGVCVKSEPELDRDDDSYNDPPLPITFATASPSSSPQPATPSSLPSSPHHRVLRDSPPSLNITGPSLDSSAHLMPVSTPTHIKVEPDLLAHSPGHAIFPRFFIPTVRSPLVMAAPSVQDRSGRSGESSGAPYCKNCDISFTYHSTFIAHKKYYCTERNTVPHSATA